MEKKIIFLWIVSVFLFNSIEITSGIMINEVGAKNPEFVEIYNPTNEILNLSEWQIKDGSGDNSHNPDNITCYNIANCSLSINYTYFIIIERGTNITSITNEPINYFYVDDSDLGYGLNDPGDNITFYNSTFSSFFSWSSSSADLNKSWQFYNNIWQECNRTPGKENYCPANIILNTTNSSLNLTNSSLPAIINNTPNIASAVGQNVSLEWGEEDITNSSSFEIIIKASNLESINYSVKIYITFKQNDTIISDNYNTLDDKWKSGTYYLQDFFMGPGNKSKEVEMKIRENYKIFKGEAWIHVKLKKGEDVILQTNKSITILAGKNKTTEESVLLREMAEDNLTLENKQNNDTKSIINLNQQQQISTINKTKDNIVYKSKNEKIKDYATYGFAGFLIFVIAILLIRN